MLKSSTPLHPSKKILKNRSYMSQLSRLTYRNGSNKTK